MTKAHEGMNLQPAHFDAIVFLMTVKLAMLGSVISIVVAIAIGLIAAKILLSRVSTTISAMNGKTSSIKKYFEKRISLPLFLFFIKRSRGPIELTTTPSIAIKKGNNKSSKGFTNSQHL